MFFFKKRKGDFYYNISVRDSFKYHHFNFYSQLGPQNIAIVSLVEDAHTYVLIFPLNQTLVIWT